MKQAWVRPIFGVALICWASIIPVSADPPDFSICDGLTGAAWGLCRGGVAAGCTDGSGSATACVTIEENFRSVTGEDAPWITPPVSCPCDYRFHVSIDTAWLSTTDVVFRCAGDEATFQTLLPLPQLPVVNAIRTLQDPPQPICQAATIEGVDVQELLNEAELRACREDVIDYGQAAIAEHPHLVVEDFCSPLL